MLYIDTPPKVNNPDYEELEIEPLESKLREQTGRVVALDELHRIPDLMLDLAERRSQYREDILRCRDTYIYNFGTSAAKSADYLIDFCKKDSGNGKS